MNVANLIDAPVIMSTQPNTSFVDDVFAGLSAASKTLPSKYFYDDKGSQLFQNISQHPDYYLTKKEYEILDQNKDLIPTFMPDAEIDIIELGVGDGHKTERVLQGFLSANSRVNFYPIDISEKALTFLKAELPSHYLLTIHGIIGDYLDGLNYLQDKSTNKKLVLFLGSNIGNFKRKDALRFLQQINRHLRPKDMMLIGFDLKKDIGTLTRAYNDSAGYTRDFNLNLLQRINSELGATFNLKRFEHYGTYNPALSAMESFIISLDVQEVYIQALNHSFYFDKYEPIHVEYSFKYSEADIQFLSDHSGFEVVSQISDSADYFINSLWQKPSF